MTLDLTYNNIYDIVVVQIHKDLKRIEAV